MVGPGQAGQRSPRSATCPRVVADGDASPRCVDEGGSVAATGAGPDLLRPVHPAFVAALMVRNAVEGCFADRWVDRTGTTVPTRCAPLIFGHRRGPSSSCSDLRSTSRWSVEPVPDLPAAESGNGGDLAHSQPGLA